MRIGSLIGTTMVLTCVKITTRSTGSSLQHYLCRFPLAGSRAYHRRLFVCRWWWVGNACIPFLVDIGHRAAKLRPWAEFAAADILAFGILPWLPLCV